MNLGQTSLKINKYRYMIDLQKQFLKFHDTIKIDFKDNKPLRDKRNLIIKNLRDGLIRKYPENAPTFSTFNQGSYDLATGVEPLQGEDYDIDVGIVFDIPKKRNKPVELKQKIHEILNISNRKVEIMRPCVRVQYHKAEEIQYHVDLAIYAKGSNIFGSLTNELFIAKGRAKSLTKYRIWEPSEPFKLNKLLKSKYPNQSDRDQFRRIIRYLKRWKDYNFSKSGYERPTGIALTACCYKVFKVDKQKISSNSYQYNDIKALYFCIIEILNLFNRKTIKVALPVRPYNNLFEKMSNKQLMNFKTKLNELKTTLEIALEEKQKTKACMRLRSIFGGSFPTA